jgi:hypothetical protein
MTAAAVVPVAANVELGVLHANAPAELLRVATEAANALAGVIQAKSLYNTISGRRYVRVEGWTTLSAMMGCLPREVTEATRQHQDGSYEATVELVRISDGAILTRASAECGMDEPLWADRPDYARRSMAVTRATSKACRIAFSWVMVLAGYEPAPAEEIPDPAEAPRSSGPRWKGKPMVDMPTDDLVGLKAWMQKTDPKKWAEKAAQIDEILGGRS